MKRLVFATFVALVPLLTVGSVSAQSELSCESRNFQHQFCPTSVNVNSASLIVQQSRSACVQGQTWGWNDRGIWVSNGCAGRFRVDGFTPPPWNGGIGQRISCDSDNFRHQFCNVNGRVASAQLVRQRSRSACVLGRSWGWSGDGVWVSDGCQADFTVQASLPPLRPTGPGLMVCDSDGFRHRFCSTGPIRDAQLVQQRSRAACVRGRTWGTQGNGIWVDNGCQATFRVFRR